MYKALQNQELLSVLFPHAYIYESTRSQKNPLIREEYAQNNETEYILLDGSPGIGCPVIASITSVDKILIVTEPSKSAVSDLKRLILLIKYFNIPMSLIINKSDIFTPIIEEIVDLCKINKIEIISKIPYNEKVIEALNNNQSIIQYDSNNVVSREIKKISDKIFN